MINGMVRNSFILNKISVSNFLLLILIPLINFLINDYFSYIKISKVTTYGNEFFQVNSVDSSKVSDINYFNYLPFIVNSEKAFYVSTNGNDSNPGTFELPWRTIGKAANMSFPGILVYIRGGIYNEVVEVRTSGTESQPIRFKAYPGETPIIDGNFQIPTYWVGLFSMWGDWIKVSGIETRNSKYDGLGLYGDHDTASNVFVHHNRYRGILIKSNYGTVENSFVWRNSLLNENGTSSIWSSGISAALDFDDGISDYSVISNNLVWGNWGEGLSTFNANGTIIENNKVYDNWSANIYVSDATDIIVNRNIVYATGDMVGGTQVGIMMGDEQYNPPSSDITIINNIVYGANRNFYWWQGNQGGGMTNVLIANNTFINSSNTSCVKILPGAHQNSRFMNNIIQQEGSLPVIQIFQSTPGLVFSHNLWSKTPSSEASGLGDIIQDPLLLKTGDRYDPNWYRLSIQSPAINHAVLLQEVTADYFNYLRGENPDIGAVEYNITP